MTLPLFVSIADHQETHRVAGLKFRKAAIGGGVSVQVRLASPLTDVPVDYFDNIVVTDDTGAVVIRGEVSDPGRSASVNGQLWDIAARGRALHASDQKRALIYITQDLGSFRQVDRNNRGMTGGVSTKPDNSADDSPDGILFTAPEGSTVGTGNSVTMRYDGIRDAGMSLARISFDVDGGSTDSDYDVKLQSSVDGAGGSVHYTFSLSATASTGNAEVITTDFASGRNVFDFLMVRSSGTGKPGTDNKWGFVYNLIVRTRLRDQDGTSISTGASYGNDYVLAHEVVKDLLGRCLPDYDGSDAHIDTGGTHQIDSLTFPDGITAAEVFDALMGFEKAYRWWVDDEADRFRWEPLPTEVRYLATLQDGGEFPASTATLYNKLTVRYVDKRGRAHTFTWTNTDAGVSTPLLDDAGKIRSDFLDLGDEVGTRAGAERRATSFLANHAVPLNGGTLSIKRKILDRQSGRMVEPWEIQPGELIQVADIESYPDALNADSNDGVTVFRIYALDYDSDEGGARLELDTYTRSTKAALVKLLKQRRPKR